MSYADEIFIKNARDIIDHGYSDAEYEVRPHWGGRDARAHDQMLCPGEPL